MRRELYNRGVITAQAFESEVRQKAIRSQAVEGMHDPFAEEPGEVWDLRMTRIRDHLTDFYFAYNLPYEHFEGLVRDVLAERGAGDNEMLVSFNPELAPQSMLFEQALAIEKMLPEERLRAEARLREIKVVLIRTLISDQLGYVNIAKDWFKISDLREIRKRKFGQGKIGGKAAGILLAARILNEVGDEDICSYVRVPESYYIGADITYDFMTLNGLLPWADQKYKTEEQIQADYAQLQAEFQKGELPSDLVEKLRGMLERVGPQPLVVRSSSLLEDNFGTSFAGKYDSYFCPNQGTQDENLAALTDAVVRIYASILNPDALLYRRAKGLQDYDERMAILIQVVQGERYGHYFLPHAAGVGFSRNLYRWAPQINREDGFVRLVWGLGTRAVDRVGNDYARLVALSHPLLHPEASPKEIRRYSQQNVDLIDLKDNSMRTLPVHEVLEQDYPVLRYLVQLDRGGYLMPMRSRLLEGSTEQLVLTFDELLRRTPLADRLRKMLKILEQHYRTPVDTEFAVRIVDPASLHPEVEISLVQCRPQSHLLDSDVHLPVNLEEEKIIFSTPRMVPRGRATDIRYVIFVPPEEYYILPTPAARAELRRAIGRLNAELDGRFICVGPGRWGTTNPDLGIKVGYGDIYNTCALVEVTGSGMGHAPEASFGTHFFQDLVESNIYPLAVYLNDEDAVFNRDFFYYTPNQLGTLFPDVADLGESLRLIEVASFRPNHHIELVMDDEKRCAVAYLVED
jgi:hypothetical protein